MKIPPHSKTPTEKAPGRPSSLTKTEEQRYVTLRTWGFSQREAGALARNPSRGRNGTRSPLGASTCQRLDSAHGPFAQTPIFPTGHSTDSLRKLPERALVALADARGNVDNRRYLEAAGLRPTVKRTKPVKKPFDAHDTQLVQVGRHTVLAEESVTFRAWHRAQFVHAAFSVFPARTQAAQLKNVREWCRELSTPVELDAEARLHLTPWERIAATWDGEFISDADRDTLTIPFRNADHPRITPTRRAAILAARGAMHSKRPQPLQAFGLPPFEADTHDAAPIEAPPGVSAEDGAAIRRALQTEKQATRRVTRWAGDDAGEWQTGPFDVDYDEG